MINVLYGYERTQHRRTFEKLFKLRHDVFIKNRGWSLPATNGVEIDQYDTDDAAYLFDQDETGAIRAHLRLTPSLRSSLIADYFPHLVENGINPRDASICEGTRWMVLPTQRNKTDLKTVKAGFMAAIAEWAIEQGYSHLQTVVDAGTLASYVEVSLLTTPLGLAHAYGGGKGVPGGGECLAFRMPMCTELLKDIFAYGRLPDPRTALWQRMPREAA